MLPASATTATPSPPLGVPESPKEALFRFVARHPRLLVLTGAGCSTGSGIPDYRDADGAWKHRKPVSYADFVSSLLVVGSSLMVFSGYRFCLAARELGRPIAAVNLGRTRAEALLDLRVALDCGLVLPALAANG